MALMAQMYHDKFIPAVDDDMDIGTLEKQFKDLYIHGLAYIDGLGENCLVSSTNQLQFRDTGVYIYSADDGHLDIHADVSIDLNANVSLGSYSLTTTGAISAHGYKCNVVNKTGDYLATLSDDVILCDASSGNIIITLPDVATSSYKTLTIKALVIGGGNHVLIETPSSVYIDGVSDKTITTNYEVVRLVAYGNAWYII